MTHVSGQEDDLDSVSDEELAVWYEEVRQAAERANRDSSEGWNGQLHVAERTPLSRVREELRRAGYTAEKLRKAHNINAPLPDPGSQVHNEWHLTHPGQSH